MKVVQVSVFLENNPGHLERALAVLAEANLNIITLTIADTADFGVLRMVLNQPERAMEALRAAKFTCRRTEVLAVEIPDRPGALHHVLRTCASRQLNIEYMYAFTEKRGDRAVMIFRFEDLAAATTALLEENVTLVQSADLIGN